MRFFLIFTILGWTLTNTARADEKPKYIGPLAETVHEDTEREIPISISDPDKDLDTVKLEVQNGILKITKSGSVSTTGDNTKQMILSGGSTDDINNSLKSLIYKGNLNFVGQDKLTVTFNDKKNNKDKKVISITVNHVSASSQACDPSKTLNGGAQGFWGNWSAGPSLSYSLVQYNLADKKSSLNATAAGVGISFRHYDDTELTKFGETYLNRSRKTKDVQERKGPIPDGEQKWAEDTDITDIPSGCRAETYEFYNEDKIHSWISISPTMYAFQEKNADDFGVQFAINIGFLDDIFTIGAGWNLSGDNAGEWFILAGPSIGFGF